MRRTGSFRLAENEPIGNSAKIHQCMKIISECVAVADTLEAVDQMKEALIKAADILGNAVSQSLKENVESLPFLKQAQFDAEKNSERSEKENGCSKKNSE